MEWIECVYAHLESISNLGYRKRDLLLSMMILSCAEDVLFTYIRILQTVQTQWQKGKCYPLDPTWSEINEKLEESWDENDSTLIATVAVSFFSSASSYLASLPLSSSSFGDLNKSVSIGSWPQNTTIGKYSLRSMIDSKILVGIVIFFLYQYFVLL